MIESLRLANSRAPDTSAISRARAGETALLNSEPTRKRLRAAMTFSNALPQSQEASISSSTSPASHPHAAGDSADLRETQAIVRVND